MSVIDKDMVFLKTYADYYPSGMMKRIREHKEEAKEIFRKALHAYADTDEYDNDNFILNAILFEAEFHDTEVFEDVMKILTVPADELEDRFGDALTECFSTAMYHLYDGNIDLLLSAFDTDANMFIKSDCLDIICKLYEEGYVSREFCRQVIVDVLDDKYQDQDAGILRSTASGNAALLHFFELKEKIRTCYKNYEIDPMIFGQYSDLIDYMYDYENERKNKFNIADRMTVESQLGKFVRFDGQKTIKEQTKDFDFEKMLNEIQKDLNNKTWKYTDRSVFVKPKNSEKCFCGSGKLYKNCCKKKAEKTKGADDIVPYRRKMHLLTDYPPLSFDPFTSKPTGFDPKNQPSLEQEYDRESILIDVYLYMAMSHEVLDSMMATDKERIDSLKLFDHALQLFKQKYEKEQLSSLEEYDQKYGIHFRCEEWMRKYRNLMEAHKPYSDMQEVLDVYYK